MGTLSCLLLPHQYTNDSYQFYRNHETLYFILSLPRFISIFGSTDAMSEKLVWLPTWHQARLLCRRLEIEDKEIAVIWSPDRSMNPGDELLVIYQKLADALRHPRS